MLNYQVAKVILGKHELMRPRTTFNGGYGRIRALNPESGFEPDTS